MGHEIVYHSLSDVGRDRELNEDNHGQFELESGGVLLVVCDGMGGHEGGEVASEIAVAAIGEIFQRSPSKDPAEKLRNGFRVANQRILTEAERTNSEGMGTTAVALFAEGDRFTTAHVGDSRVYVIRDGAVAWRTTDHTRVQKMVEKGIISEEEAKEHPDANVVTHALGYRETADGEPIEADVSPKPMRMRAGDTLVLCSDGLFDGVTDQEIARTVTGVRVEAATAALIDFANERGGHDNITVSVLRYGEEAAAKPVAKPKKQGGAKRITDLDEPAAAAAPRDARQTELDDPEEKAPGARRVAAKPVASAEKEDEDKRRRLVAIVMLLVAAAIVALVLYLLLGRGDDDRKKGTSGDTPSDQSPGSQQPGAAPSTGSGPGKAGTPGTGGVDDAPPLPENPISGRKSPGGTGGDGPQPGALQPPDPDEVQIAPTGAGGKATAPPSMKKKGGATPRPTPKPAPKPAPKASPKTPPGTTPAPAPGPGPRPRPPPVTAPAPKQPEDPKNKLE